MTSVKWESCHVFNVSTSAGNLKSIEQLKHAVEVATDTGHKTWSALRASIKEHINVAVPRE